MEPRTKSALVMMLAVGWLVVGFAAADAAATQETETVVVGHVAAEATTPSAVSSEQATRRQPADPAGAMSLLLPGKKVRVYLLSAENDDDEAQTEGTLVDAGRELSPHPGRRSRHHRTAPDHTPHRGSHGTAHQLGTAGSRGGDWGRSRFGRWLVCRFRLGGRRVRGPRVSWHPCGSPRRSYRRRGWRPDRARYAGAGLDRRAAGAGPRQPLARRRAARLRTHPRGRFLRDTPTRWVEMGRS